MVPHHGSYRSGFRPLKTTCLLGEIPAGIDLHRALADPWGSLHETFPPNRGIFPPGADAQRGPAPCRRSELFIFGDSQAFRQLGLGLEQPPAHLGLCRSGLPLHTHRANGRSRGAAAGPGQLRAAAASFQISGLSSYYAAVVGARAPRPSALDECRTRHPPSTGSRHGARNTGACG